MFCSYFMKMKFKFIFYDVIYQYTRSISFNSLQLNRLDNKNVCF